MNPSKPYCKCGVLKTPSTTSVRCTKDNSIRYHYICKSCDNIRASKQRWAKLTTEKLTEILATHLTNAENIRQVLKERFQNDNCIL